MMHKNRTIPYSEFRDTGMKLLLDKTSTSGVIISSFFAAVLVAVIADLIIWFMVIAAEIFGIANDVTRGASYWLTIPFSSGQTLDQLLLLPLRLFPQFWKATLLLFGLFSILSTPLKISQQSQTDTTRKFWNSRFPVIVFCITLLTISLIILLPYLKKNTHSFSYPIPYELLQNPITTLFSMIIFCGIFSFILTIIWKWGIFQGMILFHKLLIYDENRVTINDICAKFTDRDEIL